MKLARYNKLWVAILFFGLMIAMQHYGFQLAGLQPIVLDLIVSALGAFGVYQVRNA
jgi:hypothetical protein